MMISVLFYEPRRRMPDLDEQIFQTNQGNWRFYGLNGGFQCIDQGTLYHTWYGNMRMVKMNIYRLWCQDRVFLKYYTAFTIVFLVDTLELPKQLPNFENDFTGQLTKIMSQIGAVIKGPQTQLCGKLYKYKIRHPFERIDMDLAGPYPMSQRGNQYILVVADYFSKWCEA